MRPVLALTSLPCVPLRCLGYDPLPLSLTAHGLVVAGAQEDNDNPSDGAEQEAEEEARDSPALLVLLPEPRGLPVSQLLLASDRRNVLVQVGDSSRENATASGHGEGGREWTGLLLVEHLSAQMGLLPAGGAGRQGVLGARYLSAGVSRQARCAAHISGEGQRALFSCWWVPHSAVHHDRDDDPGGNPGVACW